MNGVLPVIPAPAQAQFLAGTPTVFAGREAIAAYFEKLNADSPCAVRRIVDWPEGAGESFELGSVPLAAAGGPADQAFIAEGRTSFALDIQTIDIKTAPALYAVGVPLCGSVHVTLAHGEFRAEAGEGVIIEPGDIECTRIAAGTHFVEFFLPRSEMSVLAAEWAPGLGTVTPRFAPVLAGELAQRLLFMASQAARALQSGRPPVLVESLFKRWRELISVTLLQEQPVVAASAPRLGLVGGPAPATLRRAVDFIQGHAEQPLGLADIATAACSSASSLLRLFNRHLGLSPVAFLRAVRLQRARAELSHSSGGAVREIALRWGFQNASKFSRAYAAEFGETPSQTRARRR